MAQHLKETFESKRALVGAAQSNARADESCGRQGTGELTRCPPANCTHTHTQSMPVFVTFVTAGFPRPDMTVDVMLAMEAGGADVIELGVPFSDPIADGPAIQQSNVVRTGLICVGWVCSAGALRC